MQAQMLKLLKFMNCLDRAGRLSITNLGVIVLLVKVAVSPNMDWAVVAGLLVTLLNYGHKRVNEQKTVEVPQTSNEAIEAIKKTANEAKDLAQKLSLAAGLNKLK